MSNISIVTAFFDIGRGSWTPEQGYPSYIKRDTDTYIDRFLTLCELDTDITLFTSIDIEEKIRQRLLYRKPKTTIISVDLFKTFAELRNRIINIQTSQDFKNKINPSVASNPEYRNPDYVLVTNLKAFFVNEAIRNGVPEKDMVAWIDFGYCRDNSKIPESKDWNFNFSPEKLHLFSYKQPTVDRSIQDVIANNDVYILGAKAVAHKRLWPVLSNLMRESWLDLQRINMVDDDQGLWLMSYLKFPELFELHQIPDHQLGHDPFVLFNNFNNTL